jgi:hypothetical protein
MDFRIFRERLQGSKPSNWRIPYIIGKILECRCLKWVHMTHLDIWNTSYGQKKGQKSNCQMDFRFPYVQMACEGYNFASNLISMGSMHTKLRAIKVVEVLILGIQDSHLGIPRQNATWMLIPWLVTEYTIRGKVVASPKLGPWWVLWVWILPVVRPSTKSASIMH